MTVLVVAGTSAAAEWCKENLRWAAAAPAAGAPEFRDTAAAARAADRLPSYPAVAMAPAAQILQFQMSTQS